MVKTKISGLILTHNNKTTIKKTVESIKPLIDELIVIDDYSIDNTLDIIRKNYPKVKIYKRKLNNDFAAQRNFALSKAKHEWVLFIDSDEEVTKELRKEIQKVLQNPKYDAYMSRRDNQVINTYYPSNSGRPILLKRELRFKGLIHEQIFNVKFGYLRSPLLHHCWINISFMLKDLDRYSTWDALKWLKERKFNSFQLLLISLLMPIYSFIQHYVIYKKYKGGIVGFVYSLAHSSIWWFKVLKYYEIKINKK